MTILAKQDQVGFCFGLLFLPADRDPENGFWKYFILSLSVLFSLAKEEIIYFLQNKINNFHLGHLHNPENVPQKIQERQFYLILYHLELKT